MANNDALRPTQPPISTWQIVQSVLTGAILMVASGIYNNYNKSVDTITEAIKQLSIIQNQMVSIQEKVTSIPSLTSEIITLRVKYEELDKRVVYVEKQRGVR